MFVTQRQLERALGYAKEERDRLTQRYWDLWEKHERLLKHLGLYEEKLPEKIKIRVKCGLERDDS